MRLRPLLGPGPVFASNFPQSSAPMSVFVLEPNSNTPPTGSRSTPSIPPAKRSGIMLTPSFPKRFSASAVFSIPSGIVANRSAMSSRSSRCGRKCPYGISKLDPEGREGLGPVVDRTGEEFQGVLKLLCGRVGQRGGEIEGSQIVRGDPQLLRDLVGPIHFGQGLPKLRADPVDRESSDEGAPQSECEVQESGSPRLRAGR